MRNLLEEISFLSELSVLAWIQTFLPIFVQNSCFFGKEHPDGTPGSCFIFIALYFLDRIWIFMDFTKRMLGFFFKSPATFESIQSLAFLQELWIRSIVRNNGA